MNLGQRLGIAQRIAQASAMAAREGVVMSDRHYISIDPSWGDFRTHRYCERSSDWRVSGVVEDRNSANAHLYEANIGRLTRPLASSVRSRLPSCPPRKIPPETASLIRALYDGGNRTYRDLGKQFGCGFRCIGQIVNREGAYRFDP